MLNDFQGLPIPSKINLITGTQVGGQTRFNGFTYMGVSPYDVAKLMAEDPVGLVAYSKAYFRPGSETDYRKILYVLMRKDDNSPIFLIPEPLVNAGSVEQVQMTKTIVDITGDYTPDQISIILSSNGITSFKIRQEHIG